jgi:hypothetical protein
MQIYGYNYGSLRVNLKTVSRLLVLAGCVAAIAMVAQADSNSSDPTVKITIPADPSCSDPNTVCFSANSTTDPVLIAGSLTLPFDITTTFIYACGSDDEPACSSLPTLDTLYLAIDPTIPGAIYNCILSSTALEAAFNACNGVGVFINDEGSSDLLLALTCTPTPTSPCTGMLPGEAGTAEVSPEPSDLALLGIGICFLGLFGIKKRKLLQADPVNHDDCVVT